MIPVERSDGWIRVGNEQIPLDEAEQVADRIRDAVNAARAEAALAACEAAGGHMWAGYDAYAYTGLGPGPEHFRVEWCTRDNCPAERTLPGWRSSGRDLKANIGCVSCRDHNALVPCTCTTRCGFHDCGQTEGGRLVRAALGEAASQHGAGAR